jgi:hypothetical protein
VDGEDFVTVTSICRIRCVGFVDHWAANDAPLLGLDKDDRPPHEVNGSGRLVSKLYSITNVGFVIPPTKLENVANELDSENETKFGRVVVSLRV